MDNTLLIAGVACVAAAIAGGGLTAFGVNVPLVSSIRRQMVLGGFGLLLLVIGLPRSPDGWHLLGKGHIADTIQTAQRRTSPSHVGLPDVTRWPLIAADSFTRTPPAWTVGSYPNAVTRRLDLSMLGGNYRWDVEFAQPGSRWVTSSFGSALNCFVAIDVTMEKFGPHTQAGLMFGQVQSGHYTFWISGNRNWALTWTDAAGNYSMMVNWTIAAFDPAKANKMAVVVQNGEVSLFLNSEMLVSGLKKVFAAGDVGLAVTDDPGAEAVLDFGSFEYRLIPR